jgi:hypothetical protein
LIMVAIIETMAAQSGHWYSRDGTPAYEIIGANGKQRPTTLRDARKLDLVPSVSGIIKMAAAPGLERWKIEQTLLAALTLPRIDGESLDDYANRVMKDSAEQGKKAMELGTFIHASLEKSYIGESFPGEHVEHCAGTHKAIADHFGQDILWSAEKSFCHELGYGGKCDLHHKDLGFASPIPEGVVIDFKTKDFGPDKIPDTWDEHALQLAAYREGFCMPSARCAIVYVSTTTPGLAVVKELPEDELDRGWRMFVALLTYWKAKNKA